MSLNAVTGRFVYKDPDVELFSQRPEIKLIEQESGKIIGAAMSKLSAQELANDATVCLIWTNFKTDTMPQLYNTFFPDSPDFKKYEGALIGPLLDVFQQCVIQAGRPIKTLRAS